MTLYVVTSLSTGIPVTELLTVHQLAELIGCSDYNERSSFHVWRVMDQGCRMEPLNIIRMNRESCIYLEDRYGNYVDGADYPMH